MVLRNRFLFFFFLLLFFFFFFAFRLAGWLVVGGEGAGVKTQSEAAVQIGSSGSGGDGGGDSSNKSGVG